MIIAIGADHGGFRLKEILKRYLKEKNYEIIDCGTNSNESVDYPDFGLEVAEKVFKKDVDKGILICTTGIGQSIVANKVPGIRAALCFNEEQAEYSRRHNDANVLVFGAKYMNEVNVKRIVDTWFAAKFEGGRHKKRIDKIRDIEKKYCKELYCKGVDNG